MLGPARGDVKLAVARIVNDLEVVDERRTPFKLMRYPLIVGDKRKKLLDTRISWLQEVIGMSYVDADQWAHFEFKAFFSTEDDLIDQEDPGQLLDYLQRSRSPRDDPLDQSFLDKVKSETKRFFVLADDGFIRKTPMKTYQQLRYGTTSRIDLLRGAELPDKMDYWSHNAGKLINIITQDSFKFSSGLFRP